MAETVLVTGASSGIGLELARCFARAGANLILVARTERKLQELAAAAASEFHVTAGVIPCDLSRPDAAAAIAAEIERRGQAVDVLVNNAGFGDRGAFAERDVDRQLSMIQVNVTSLTHLTRLLLPGMLARGRGGVLNVASTAAFQPGPNMAVYYATKAYVLSFSEALVEEVGQTGVTISCLAPGPTDTGFAAEANLLETRLFKLGTMSAAEVASAGYGGFRNRKALVVPGLRNQLGAFAVRLAPRAMARKITAGLQA
ncbi:MAG: SDR family NAD(P)-dependent oxidoreductase [Luteitalea sp.]|nr:SDR family NAD(P)-dependent oxidoreductase [Luteitalea sp.]